MPMYRPHTAAEEAATQADAIMWLVRIAARVWEDLPEGEQRDQLGVALSPFHDGIAARTVPSPERAATPHH